MISKPTRKTGYCPECNDWYQAETGNPSKAPSPKVPTEQPVAFRSWANDNWMNDIKRRDSAGIVGSRCYHGIAVSFILTAMYYFNI